jgi:hypothetical protein
VKVLNYTIYKFTKNIMIDILLSIGLENDPDVARFLARAAEAPGAASEGGAYMKGGLFGNKSSEQEIKYKEQIFVENVKIVYNIVKFLSVNFTNFFFLYERIDPPPDIIEFDNILKTNTFIDKFIQYMDAVMQNLPDWKTKSIDGTNARNFIAANPTVFYSSHYGRYQEEQLKIQTATVIPTPAAKSGFFRRLTSSKPETRGGKRRTLKRS